VEILAQFGPAGAIVAVVWIFVKYFVPVIEKLSKAIDQNTRVTKETKEFLVNLNGSLKRTVQEKIEQNKES